MASSSHIGQLVFDHLQTDPEEICQIDGSTGETETRKSVWSRSIKMAKHMTKLGLKKDDVVTVCAYNQNDTCLPVAASFYKGFIVNGLDMKMSKMEFENLLHYTKPKMIFSEIEKAELFLELSKKLDFETKIVTFGDSGDSRFLAVQEFYDNDYTTEDFKVTDIDPTTTIAYILCSSGSTGLPKGVIHTHATSAMHMKAIRGTYNNHTLLQFSSLYWISGIVMTVFNLIAPTKKINARPFTPQHFIDMVEKYKGNICVFPPSSMRMIIQHPGIEKADLSSVKQFMLTGSTIDFEDIKQMQKYCPNGKVINSFGMTEVGGPVTYTLNDETLRVGSCGRVLPYIQAKVVDRTTKETLPANKVGELYIKSPCIMKGYYNNPEATREVLNEDGWIITGDLGKFDEDGYLYIVDRIKDMFKVRGFSIAPVVLENLVNTYPGVKDCVVVSVEDKDEGCLAMAYIVRQEDSKICEDEIHNFIKDNLASYYELKGGIIFVDNFEKTPSGKVSRNKMRQLAKTKFEK